MQTDAPAKPQPAPTAESAAFWEASKDGRLLIQQCGSCGTLRHYPRPLCDRCYSLEIRWVEASGRGAVHSWTVAHHPYHPAFKAEVPYVLLTVDLEEGVRQMGRFEGSADELRLGLPVTMEMKLAEGGFGFPSFRTDGAERPDRPGKN